MFYLANSNHPCCLFSNFRLKQGVKSFDKLVGFDYRFSSFHVEATKIQTVAVSIWGNIKLKTMVGSNHQPHENQIDLKISAINFGAPLNTQTPSDWFHNLFRTGQTWPILCPTSNLAATIWDSPFGKKNRPSGFLKWEDPMTIIHVLHRICPFPSIMEWDITCMEPPNNCPGEISKPSVHAPGLRSRRVDLELPEDPHDPTRWSEGHLRNIPLPLPVGKFRKMVV